MALYLESMAPIVIFYLIESGKRWLALCVSLIVFVGLLTTFSAAGIAALSIACCFAAFFYAISHPKKGLAFLAVFILCGVLLFFIISGTIYYDFILGIYDKLTFSGDVSSTNRLEVWDKVTVAIIDKHLLAHGVVAFSDVNSSAQNGIISFWLQLLFEGGLVVVLLFFSLFALLVYRSMKFPFTRKYGYLISLVAMFVHYAVISDYWRPWLWFIMALVLYETVLLSKRNAVDAKLE